MFTKVIKWSFILVLSTLAFMLCHEESKKEKAFDPDGHYLDSILRAKGWTPGKNVIVLPPDTSIIPQQAHHYRFLHLEGGIDTVGQSRIALLNRDTVAADPRDFSLGIALDGMGSGGRVLSFEDIRRANRDREIRLAKRYDSVLQARAVRQNFIAL